MTEQGKKNLPARKNSGEEFPCLSEDFLVSFEILFSSCLLLAAPQTLVRLFLLPAGLMAAALLAV